LTLNFNEPSITGLVSDIQKFSLHDGPGIRTVVFLKGCNMHCPWCHNPESIASEKTLEFISTKCIGCGSCVRVCPTGALHIDSEGLHLDRALCNGCGACAEVCPSHALSMIGRRMSVDEVFRIVISDKQYYDNSGGGVTISGGEPLIQARFTAGLLHMCRDAGIDTAIESNLCVSQQVLELIVPYLNRVYCDLKLFDDAMHCRVTGVSNKNVLENISFVSTLGIPVTVRTPIIPGFTDAAENIRSIAAFLATIPIQAYELLPYNPFAAQKHSDIGIPYGISTDRISQSTMDILQSIAASEGAPVAIPKKKE
jgi:pyruvate formate lyase activating enzyme